MDKGEKPSREEVVQALKILQRFGRDGVADPPKTERREGQ